MQNLLVFQPVHWCFKKIANNDYISALNLNNCLMKVLNLLLHFISCLSFGCIASALNLMNTKIRLKFDGRRLKQDKVTLTHKKVVHFHIVY